MTRLSNKENVWSAAIGILIGSIAGMMISLSMVREHRKCEAMKRENQMMKEMLIYYQD